MGKGAAIVVTDGGEWVVDDHSDDLNFLGSHFDRRELGFSTSATGTVFDRDVDTKGIVLLPRWNTEHTSFEALRPIFEHILKVQIAMPNPCTSRTSSGHF